MYIYEHLVSPDQSNGRTVFYYGIGMVIYSCVVLIASSKILQVSSGFNVLLVIIVFLSLVVFFFLLYLGTAVSFFGIYGYTEA